MNWMKMKCQILQFCVVSLGLFVLYLVLCVCGIPWSLCMCHSKGVVCPSFRCLLGLLLAALFGTYLASYSRRG